MGPLRGANIGCADVIGKPDPHGPAERERGYASTDSCLLSPDSSPLGYHAGTRDSALGQEARTW